MSGPIAGLGKPSAPTGGAADDAKLRNAARQLEGVFTQQLFKAMRETVPEDQGAIGGSSAQDMFTGLLDEHLASDPRASSTHGIGEAIYHHLLRSRGGATAPTTPAPVTATATPAGLAPLVTPPPGGASLRKTS